MGLFDGLFGSQPTYQYTQSPELQEWIKLLGTQMKGLQPTNDPYSKQMGQWYNAVMNPNYSAMSPEQMDQQYNTQANDLINNAFKPNENRFAARMANQGLSGATYGGKRWREDVISPENTALANLKGQINQNNWGATQANKQQAVGMMPTVSSIYTQNQRYPLEMQMNWLNALLGENSARNSAQMNAYQQALQQNSQNSSGLGSVLGSVLGFFL